MPFVKKIWKNLPSLSTPIEASELNRLETQYDHAMEDVRVALGDPDSPIGERVSEAIAEQVEGIDPLAFQTAVENAAAGLRIVHETTEPAVQQWAGAIGPEGHEDKTWLQYNVFGEPTQQSIDMLARSGVPALVAGSPPADLDLAPGEVRIYLNDGEPVLAVGS